MTSFQYLSDLHLEFRSKIPTIPNIAPYLILVGDIGRIDGIFNKNILEKFLRDCVSKWNRVIYVPGNHEFYGVSFEEGIEILKKMCHNVGVDFLAPGIVHIEGITIIGDTLWSKPKNKYVYEKIGDSTWTKMTISKNTKKDMKNL